MTLRTPLPDKLFFKIGEVADLVGVRPHVLRHWEAEFPSLRPMKTRGAHRVYRKRDVDLAMTIRRLLHDEGFTIAGARKRLRELGHESAGREEACGAARETALRAELLAVRDDLLRLLGAVDRIASPEDRRVGAPSPQPAAAYGLVSPPASIDAPPGGPTPRIPVEKGVETADSPGPLAGVPALRGVGGRPSTAASSPDAAVARPGRRVAAVAARRPWSGSV